MLAFMGKERKDLKILYILVTLTLGAILLYPLACVLFQSFLDKNGGLTFANYVTTLSEGSFWVSLGHSFTVSGLSALIAAALAFVSAYGLHFTRINPSAKKFVRSFGPDKPTLRSTPLLDLRVLGTFDRGRDLHPAARVPDFV